MSRHTLCRPRVTRGNHFWWAECPYHGHCAVAVTRFETALSAALAHVKQHTQPNGARP